jgi:hypothetical protein
MAVTPAALRLAWADLPGASRPGWLTACAEALAALRSAHAGAVGGADAGGGEGASDIGFAPQGLKLHLDPVPQPQPADHAPAWWLTDRHGHALDGRHPLLADITAGRGIALALWQPEPAGRGWICLRRIHVDASTHYAQASPLLAGTVARLLWQAGRNHLLGIAPASPVHPRPCAAGGPGQPCSAGGPRPAWPRVALLLSGRWKAWVARQRARWCREEWRIGIIEQPLSALTCGQPLASPHWLPGSGKLGYWADPSAQASSDSRILAEYFDEERGIGHIEQLRLSPQHTLIERQRMPLGRGRHASFPQTVQLDGRWLGLAETAALRRCELHEIDNQGLWRPLATLIPGVAAADPALFQWQGRYWLACTDIDIGAMDNLCLYHADRPEGPWQPHANNPVKVDVTGARMAGALFWHEGQLYRPAQNCLGHYGASIVLHRVTQCTPTHFEEEAVCRLDPDPNGPCPHGLHTLNPWGDRALVDGKRHVFSLALGWLKLRRRLAGQQRKTDMAEETGW